MKKSLIKNMTLGFACLLGFGGAFTASVLASNNLQDGKVAEAKNWYVDTKRYFSCEYHRLVNYNYCKYYDLYKGDDIWTTSIETYHKSGENDYGYFLNINKDTTLIVTNEIPVVDMEYIDTSNLYRINYEIYDRGGDWTGSLNCRVYIGSNYWDFSKDNTADLIPYNYDLGGKYSGLVRIEISATTSNSTYSFRFSNFGLGVKDYFSVTANLNHDGGTSTQNTVSVRCGRSMNNVQVPTKDGFVFQGYYIGDKQYYKADGTPALDKFDVTDEEITFLAHWAPATQEVNIEAGSGIKEVFVSDQLDGSNPQPSGTAYEPDTAVYGFVELKPGYVAPSSWVNVSGSIYRVNKGEAFVVESSPIDFGTQDAVNTPAVIAVKQLIAGIGEVSYPNSKPKIDEARKAYDELSADEKVTVDNYNVLTAAEDSYSALREEALPKNLSSTYGKELSSVTLPSGWSWKNPSDKVGNAGNNNHTAIYKPNDYAAEETLTVSVGKADPVLEPLTVDAPYDVALSQVGLPSGYSWVDNTLKTSTWGEHTFKVNYTPSDLANYNPVYDIDAKVNVKWILVDPTQGDVSVTVNGDDELFTVDISVKVEVKTEITVDQKRNEYASLATKDFVKPNEDISAIYGVKLIRTTNGVEEEIQPSDIKEGTKITVSMAIPEELVGKDFRLLHIHNSDDIVEVTNYAVSKDGKTLMLEVDRLSDFAFITATDADNGFIYSIGLPGWALALIIIGGILLLGILALLILFIFFPVYYIDYSKREVRRAIYLRTKHGEVLMLNTHLAKVRRNEADVYKKKSDALNALNK